jgi:hypothetical protein
MTQMKKYLSILLFLLAFNGFSQSIESLKAKTLKLYDASYTMDFETIADLTYPKIFNNLDRETIIKAMDEMFQNDIMKVRFVYPTVTFNYSPVKTIDGQKFCIIRYKNAMRLTFEEKIPEDRVDTLLKLMKQEKKYETVVFEENRNSFLATGNAILIAISDSVSKNEWTFVNYDNEDLFGTLFEKNLKTELGL